MDYVLRAGANYYWKSNGLKHYLWNNLSCKRKTLLTLLSPDSERPSSIPSSSSSLTVFPEGEGVDCSAMSSGGGVLSSSETVNEKIIVLVVFSADDMAQVKCGIASYTK